jgi:hypothetical protein
MMNMLRHAQMAYHREGSERLFKLKIIVWSSDMNAIQQRIVTMQTTGLGQFHWHKLPMFNPTCL